MTIVGVGIRSRRRVAGDVRAVRRAEQLVDVVTELAEPLAYGAKQHVSSAAASVVAEQVRRVVVQLPQDRDGPVHYL
jgi:hypothetical protein